MNLETTTTFTRVFTRALLDSTRTDDLLTGEEISSVSRMPALAHMMRATVEGRAILAERPRITSATVDLAALRRSQPGTLGRTWTDHMDRCGLDIDALSTPVTRGQDDEANYTLERVRQTHDIWHAVLGLGIEGYEEVLVHAFQWSQLRMPYSALVVTFGALKHVIGEARWPILRHALRDASLAGREAAPLLSVHWERHWEEPLDQLRRRLCIRPSDRWRGLAT